jgi:hypothetical protein
VNPAEMIIKRTGESDEEEDVENQNSSCEPIPIVKEKRKNQDLKEFTLNKFNTIEPFMIK